MRPERGHSHAYWGSEYELPEQNKVKRNKIELKQNKTKKITCYLVTTKWWWIRWSYSRHDDILKVPEDILPVLWLCRCSFRDKFLHVPWLHVWNHPPFPQSDHVLGDVVHQLLSWSVTDSVKAGHIWNKLKVQNKTNNYLCNCIPQPALFVSGKILVMLLDVLCYQWKENYFLLYYHFGEHTFYILLSVTPLPRLYSCEARRCYPNSKSQTQTNYKCLAKTIDSITVTPLI